MLRYSAPPSLGISGRVPALLFSAILRRTAFASPNARDIPHFLHSATDSFTAARAGMRSRNSI